MDFYLSNVCFCEKVGFWNNKTHVLLCSFCIQKGILSFGIVNDSVVKFRYWIFEKKDFGGAVFKVLPSIVSWETSITEPSTSVGWKSSQRHYGIIQTSDKSTYYKYTGLKVILFLPILINSRSFETFNWLPKFFSTFLEPDLQSLIILDSKSPFQEIRFHGIKKYPWGRFVVVDPPLKVVEWESLDFFVFVFFFSC